MGLVVKATTQALCLGALSNILAQVLTARNEGRSFDLDIKNFVFFLVWTLVSCPPNVMWQIFLEESFPGDKIDTEGRKRLSKSNTLKKFVADQTVGATLNTVGYLAAVAAYRGKNMAGIIAEVEREFWPLMRTGWKLWPFVALLSFTVIPLERRTLFGSCVGLFWGIYMSLLAAK